jgi:hypothetical protein
MPNKGFIVHKSHPPRISTFKECIVYFASSIEGSFDYNMDDGREETYSYLGLPRRRCFFERKFKKMFIQCFMQFLAGS